VKQEGPNSKSAFVASEAGKVSLSRIRLVSTKTNCRDQHFKFTYTNNLLDTDLRIAVYTDGVLAVDFMSPAGKQGQMLGIQKSCNSVLPFKFRELELVGAFLEHSLGSMFVSSFATEDPDLENAPVVLEMGMIELRAFRCPTEKYKRNDKSGLHRGRVSERSKMAGWHHVRYHISQASNPNSHTHVILIDSPSTGDEIPIAATSLVHVLDEIDPPNAPHATIKVTYRPRGGYFVPFLQPS
jgi:hypothetical protein